ncbi:MAG: hypothetical protein JSW72_06220 [Candidatus Bathyarchaeota archaeon]|nr:MAG: hypothetical protein JSW72_06220 [Candidatus Bathyarchaeota archaeon]
MAKVTSPVVYIDVRFSAHATENLEKTKKAVYNLFPPDRKDKMKFTKETIKGHHGNLITLFQARIKDKEVLQAFVEKLSTGLSELDKETMSREAKLLVERSNLYLRLDKQAAVENQMRLYRADPIHIRIHFKRKDNRSIIELCRELGLMS